MENDMNFELWLESLGKSPKTAKNYSRAITGSLSSWAKEAGIIVGSLQDLGSLRDFRNACERIKVLAIYEERNSRGNGMYKAALNAYTDYLEDNARSRVEEDLDQIVGSAELTITEKASLINSRLGQGKFRKRLVEYWGGCAVTGYRDSRFLVASHIKPWAKSNDRERIDPYNGLLLLPNIDKVFDMGYVSFKTSGAILISERLDDCAVFGVNPAMSLTLRDEHIPYLDFHRENCFRD